MFYYPKAGGIKEYIHNLTWNLAAIDQELDVVLYVAKNYTDYAGKNLPPKFKIKPTDFSIGKSIKRSLFEGYYWRKEEKEERFDIFHSPFFHAPNLKKAKVILTVHDLRLEVFPETYSKLRYLFLKYKVPKSIKRADHIISVSEFTKSEIIKFYKIPAQKITAIQEAVDLKIFNPNCVGSSKVINDSFILSVGHIEPRKNYLRLISAFAEFKSSHPDEKIKLVIVGQPAKGFQGFIELVNKHPDVIYLNFVELPNLLWLYKNAEFFIMPSIYEGFGFPPLEAAAMGTVSAVSNVSSLPEICGDSVIYFNPRNENEIIEAINSFYFDEELKKILLIRTKENLNRFSWEKNAQETIKIYSSLVN